MFPPRAPFFSRAWGTSRFPTPLHTHRPENRPMSGDFELEPYDASRRDAYLGLLGEAWGGQATRGGAMGGDLFDWWFEGNPAGSMRSVALRDGEVVGAAGHSICRFVVD